MPRIPLIDAKAGPRAGFGQRATAPDFGGGFGEVRLGQGISEAGENLQRIGAIEARIYDAEQRSKVDLAVADAARDTSLALETITQGPDHDQYEAQYEEAKKRISERGAEGLAEGYAPLFQQKLQEIDFRAGTALRGVVREKRVESAKANDVQSLAQFADEEARATPANKPFWRQQAAELWARGIADGVWSPLEVQRQTEAYENTITRSSVLAQLQSNPRALLNDLEKRSAPYDLLHEPERQEYIGAAKRSIEADLNARHADMMQQIALRNALEREQSNRAEMELISISSSEDQGFVTAKNVNQRLQSMTPEAAIRWQKILNNGGRLGESSGAPDPQTYLTLKAAAAEGENVDEETADAYVNGALGKSTAAFDSITDSQLKSRFTGAQDWLDTMSKPRSGIGLPPSEKDVARQADAQLRFDMWKKSNLKTATDEEANKAARDIWFSIKKSSASEYDTVPPFQDQDTAFANAVMRAIARAGGPPGITVDDAMADADLWEKVSRDPQLLRDKQAIQYKQEIDQIQGSQ